MPQFQTYPLILALASGDLLLVYQNSSGKVKAIDVTNLGAIGIAQLSVTEGADIASAIGNGRVIFAPEGGNIVNYLYSRNAANNAYLPLSIRTGGGAFSIDGPMRFASVAVAETPAATHTVAFQDANGVAYKLLCLPV